MEKFVGSNVKVLKSQEDFATWKFQIMVTLKAKDLFKYVETDKVDNEKEKDEYRAQEIIISTLSEKVTNYIINCKSAREIWIKILSIFEQDDMIKKHSDQQKFFNYKYESKGIAHHISELENVADDLKRRGETISEELLITKILMTLPAQYSNFQTVWEGTPNEMKNLKRLTERLCSEESRIKMYEDGPTSHQEVGAAFISKVKCFRCGKQGHIKKDCKVRDPKSKTELAGKPKFCSHCRKKGHTIDTCWYSKTNKKKSDNDTAFMVSDITEECTWIVDSGATAHMCKNEELFSELTYCDNKTVTIGNGAPLKVHGIGKVPGEIFDGESWSNATLHDVYFVPDLIHNLFSTNTALDKGFTLEANSSEYIFTKGDVVAKAVKREKLVYLLFRRRNENDLASVCKEERSLYQWHCVLGHQNVAAVKTILKRSNTHFTDKDFFCEPCMYGKQTRLPFQRSTSVQTQVGDLIHLDLCGPMEETSLGGCKYFLLLKDDFSKYRTVYFIKSKEETKHHIISFLQRFQNVTGKTVKVIRSDNGSDEVNSHVKSVTDSLGIVHQKTCVYTPEQNGCAERDLRTIVEGARTNLQAAKLPKKLWAEAVHYMKYTLNHTSPLSHVNKTPAELWNNCTSVDYSKLHAFGSEVFVHIPKQKRRKFDNKSRKGVFVGYDEEVKGYRIYFRDTDTVEISRDVIFKPEGFSSECEPPVSSENCIIQGNENEIEASREVNSNISENSESSQNGELCQSFYQDLKSNASDVSIESIEIEQPILSEVSNNSMNENQPDVESQPRPYNLRNRNSIKNNKFDDYILMTSENDEPLSFSDVLKSNEKEQWLEAMRKEISELKLNKTWQEVVIPDNKHIISSKWVFKKKLDGDKVIYKARLVARGFEQNEVFEFSDLYAPVSKLQTLRILLAVALQLNLKIHQMDVVGAFLHGEIKEEVFMNPPDGYEIKKNTTLKLCKSIYGLKKSPKYWNEKFNSFILNENFSRSKNDQCLYTKDGMYILLYVDDILIFCKDEDKIQMMKSKLHNNFKMKDLGPVSKFLGMQITQTDEEIVINQSQYIQSLLNRFNMADCKSVKCPIEPNYVHEGEKDPKYEYLCRSLIGGLLYLTLCSRPDITVAVNILSRYQNVANIQLWNSLKHILKYIKGTKNLSLIYRRNAKPMVMKCYADADWGSDKVTRRSTSGYTFQINGNTVVWKSKRQNSVALSTAEAEYVSLSEATSEIIWVNNVLLDLSIDIPKPIVLYEDNQSAIKIATAQASKAKHIDIRYHFVREKIEDNFVKLEYIESNSQIADILTKPLSGSNFQCMREKLGVL